MLFNCGLGACQNGRGFRRSRRGDIRTRRGRLKVTATPRPGDGGFRASCGRRAELPQSWSSIRWPCLGESTGNNLRRMKDKAVHAVPGGFGGR